MINKVFLYGRLTSDITCAYTPQDQKAVARFSVAIDRGKDKNGESRGTDFPNCVAFGKTAENCEKYLAKGRFVLIEGRLQTGSYTDKEGRKVYTTDVIAERVEFIGKAEKKEEPKEEQISGFSALSDEDIPF